MSDHTRNTLAGLIGFVLFLIALVFVVHGCYKPGEGPPCSASPTACGDYPAAHRDGGK